MLGLARATRRHPGCIVFLLNESSSMQPHLHALHKQTCRFLQKLVADCRSGDDVREYYRVGFLGYRGSATEDPETRSILPPGPEQGPLTTLKILYDILWKPDSGWVESLQDTIWNEAPPRTLGTSLAELSQWARKNSESPPPVVIHITDDSSTATELVGLFNHLRKETTCVLINFVIISAMHTARRFPATSLPPDGNQATRTLFDIASDLPPEFKKVCAPDDRSSEKLRGFWSSPGKDDLWNFLELTLDMSTGNLGSLATRTNELAAARQETEERVERTRREDRAQAAEQRAEATERRAEAAEQRAEAAEQRAKVADHRAGKSLTLSKFALAVSFLALIATVVKLVLDIVKPH